MLTSEASTIREVCVHSRKLFIQNDRKIMALSREIWHRKRDIDKRFVEILKSDYSYRASFRIEELRAQVIEQKLSQIEEFLIESHLETH